MALVKKATFKPTTEQTPEQVRNQAATVGAEAGYVVSESETDGVTTFGVEFREYGVQYFVEAQYVDVTEVEEDEPAEGEAEETEA